MNNTEQPRARLLPQNRLQNDSATRSTSPITASILIKIITTVIWGIFHFIFCFLLQISELLAPLLLILGLGWVIIPHVITIASKSANDTHADVQTQELITHVSQSFPSHLDIAGHTLTPYSLIMSGLCLMALAALSATVCAWLGRRL